MTIPPTELNDYDVRYASNAHDHNLVDLNDDETHRTVTDDEKATWNAKSGPTHNHNLADLAEKSYNSLTDKPTITNPAKVYRAIGWHSDPSNPSITVVENTLGTVTITRVDSGTYYIASSGLFTSGKTFIPSDCRITIERNNMSRMWPIYTHVNSSLIILETYDDSIESPADEFMGGLPIEIYVCN